MDQDKTGRLAHRAEVFGPRDLRRDPAAPDVLAVDGATVRPVALALTAEGPRRADLIAWASAHAETLGRMRLLAPAGIGSLLAEHAGLRAAPLRSGTIGPAATAGLAAAGDIDAMIAFSDPIELRAGDTTTRSLSRLAVFWDIPVAANRATADVLLAALITAPAAGGRELADLVGAAGTNSGTVAAPTDAGTPDRGPRVENPVATGRGPVRLWTVRATVDDVPGRLAILAASLARRAVNILSVQVHLTPEGPVDELLVAASPVLTAADLTAAVVDGGARAPRVLAADAHALVDAPTRALTLAARLLRSPDDLPAVLGSLLPGAQLVWRAEPPGAGRPGARDEGTAGDEGTAEEPGKEHPAGRARADDAGQLWLTDPQGGGYLLSRIGSPFTPAERARAYAMMDVATVALSNTAATAEETAPGAVTLVLPDSAEVAVREAGPDDLAGVVELHGRCSPASRLRRYLAGTRCPSESTLLRLLSPEPGTGRTLIAEDATGRVVAMANLLGGPHAPELAILVEDAWQRRRLGGFLARRLGQFALAAGAQRVTAVIHASNTPMVRIMSALGHRLHREYDGGLLTLVVTLRSEGHAQRLPSNRRLSQSAYGMEVPT